MTKLVTLYVHTHRAADYLFEIVLMFRISITLFQNGNYFRLLKLDSDYWVNKEIEKRGQNWNDFGFQK